MPANCKGYRNAVGSLQAAVEHPRLARRLPLPVRSARRCFDKGVLADQFGTSPDGAQQGIAPDIAVTCLETRQKNLPEGPIECYHSEAAY